MSKNPSRSYVRVTQATVGATEITKPVRARANSRIMYIECKAGDITGDARIGRVTFSKTGRTLRYKDLEFQSLKGAGFKSNYLEIHSGDDYWISGPHRDGADQLYGVGAVPIDDDVRVEYWRDIRKQPGNSARRKT